MVQNLDEKLFKEKIFDYDAGEDAPLLVKNNTILEFWVTWCPHCQAMIPRFEKISEEFPEIDCYRVEMEQHPQIAELFAVESFPTFIFIHPNGEMTKWVGELEEVDLASMVKEAFMK